MEEVKRLKTRGGGGGGKEAANEYVLFRGDAVFVTEMNVVCLSGPVTGEERITVTVIRIESSPIEKGMRYMIGKSVKLGFLMQDYCDKNGFAKESRVRFIALRVGKFMTEDQTREELGMRDGDKIVFGLNAV